VKGEVSLATFCEDCLIVKTDKEEFKADYVVLAEPLIPSSLILLKKLGVKLDEFEFPIEFQPCVIHPSESYVDRVFLSWKC